MGVLETWEKQAGGCDLNACSRSCRHQNNCRRLMLGKCSNPSCSAPFRYLRDGRLFRLEADPIARTSKPYKLEYFWLCEHCSPRMSLRIGKEGGVLPVMLPASDCGAFDGNGIMLVDRRDGLLLSKLGFARTGHGTGAVFFG